MKTQNKKTTTTAKKTPVKTRETILKNPLENLKWLLPTDTLAFYFLTGINRSIYPNQVTKLVNSLLKMGCTRPVVIAYMSFIDGIKRPYIIDGQHLFYALLRLGLKIPYVTIEIKHKQELVETIALLNASSKSWSMMEYVTAWGSLKDDYKKLEKYFNTYDIELGVVASVLSGQIPRSGVGGSESIARKIKLGLFNIVDEKKNVKILDYVTDMLNVVPRGDRAQNKYICAEYITYLRTTPEYDHQKFLKKLKAIDLCVQLAINEKGRLVEMFNKL
jgi:hypothetical protein